jgi:WhiB family redox-sensing transcriptional regulator
MVSPAASPTYLAQPEPWIEQAACHGVDPKVFFPSRGDDPRPAKKMCMSCPVRAQCLDYALRTNQAYGIWGATSERQRRRMRRQRSTGSVCSVAECTASVEARGLCVAHYMAWWRRAVFGEAS